MGLDRQLDRDLQAWMARKTRRPLILRGARQTGKTTAIRRLGESVDCFVELNLERPTDLRLVRSCRSADELLERIQQARDLPGFPPSTLIFLDEVQEHAEVLTWLRFIHEDHSDLAVVAAGSLLEVRLRDDVHPFPVGRVEFLRAEPLTFLQFLKATEGERIATDLEEQFSDRRIIDPGLHELAMEHFRRFLLTGGLPEPVAVWAETHSMVEVRRVHSFLGQAYHEDLRKYGVASGTRYMETVLAQAPAHYGARFKHRNLGDGARDAPIKSALESLERAMVLHRAVPTASTELPFVPRARVAHKLLPLDIGLASAELDVRSEHLHGIAVESLLGGRVAEAFVGIQLLAAHVDRPRSLYFWVREARNSKAEVDYVVPSAAGVLPIEVKSGTAGRLRSLHRFVSAAGIERGVRLSAGPGTVEQVDFEVEAGSRVRYRLESIPLYLAELLNGC